MRTQTKLWLAILVLALFVVPGFKSAAQTTALDLVHHSWNAQWITHPAGPRREFGVFHFRKTFAVDSVPQHFVIHVSGDNRYELFVNGKRVLEGPARGDLNNWRYETLDIAPDLVVGKNLLAAVVWNFAKLAPEAQITSETGLIVQGDTHAEEVVNTDESWKVYKSGAVTLIPMTPERLGGYVAVGAGEQVDAKQYPWGYETLGFEESGWGWVAAQPIAHGDTRSILIYYNSSWMLVPRTIPLMEDKVERLQRVVRANGVAASPEFLQGTAPITVPPNSHATLLFDQTYLTTGYPELVVRNGHNAMLTLTYAEGLWKGQEKGNRNEIEGKEMRGITDRFLPDGGQHRVFRPLWWRTFRYLQIEVVTGEAPVTLLDLRSHFTAYPFEKRASFESDDPELAKIWEVGWRTARLCAHETYMDCPYWEQLQYGGDTRIQILISLYMTGDARLAKNAIESFDESRTPEGLTQSRYPTSTPQYIPQFSTFWIAMMHDLWWYRGETDFLRNYLPGMRDVLGWFERRMAPSGMLGQLKWWNFVDWPKEFDDGRPPTDKDGQSSMLSSLFAIGLRDAADIEIAYGSRELAGHDRALAARIAASTYRLCWDSARKLIADTPEHKTFSQQANILAVLADAIPVADQRAVITAVLTEPGLTPATYYFRFYLFKAMKKVGMADDYLAQLGPWRNMLALGLTTWAETPEPSRSDCHAWSAHPNYDLLATVAGIESAAPGFSKVVIQPHLGSLKQLGATLPHPQGDITVNYQRDGDHLKADVTLPAHLTGSFVWKGKTMPLHPGAQQLVF